MSQLSGITSNHETITEPTTCSSKLEQRWQDQHEPSSMQKEEPDISKEGQGVAQMSKRELKRQLKRQLILEERPAKRAAERARKKAKKLQSKQDQGHQQAEAKSTSVPIKKPVIFPSSVVFDCRFDEKMSEKEIISLDRQLAHSYATNRRAHVQFRRLICTSFNGKLKKRLEANDNQHLRWKAFEFLSDSIEDLIDEKVQNQHDEEEGENGHGKSDQSDQSYQLHGITADSTFSEIKDSFATDSKERDINRNAKTSIHKKTEETQRDQSNYLNLTVTQEDSSQRDETLDHTLSDQQPGSFPKGLRKSDVVYLTSDSTNQLTTLDPNKVYIIGSLVDHNRYKNLCLDLANEHGFQHAQLPINQYFSQLKTRKVLTVNQVFEILVCFLDTKDWKLAFDKVIPSRKL